MKKPSKVERDNKGRFIKRTVKKSLKVDRPNFRKALKDKKEFWYRGTFKELKPLEDIAFDLGFNSRLKSTTTFIYRNMGSSNHNGWFTSHGEEYQDYIKRKAPEYNPTTDTFTESKFDNEPKKVEHKTLTTHIIKLKSDCVVMTEKEYDRLKKMEEDYNLIKKVMED